MILHTGQSNADEAAAHTPARPVVLIVSNPESGSHAASMVDGLANAYHLNGYDACFGQSSPRHKPDMTQHFDRLCIAGGDGTIRHVLAQLSAAGIKVPVDLYPAGTINLAARENGLPRKYEAFVAGALARQARPLYIASLNDTYFVVCASVSPDARAVAALSEELKKKIGRFAYAVSMLKMLSHWQRPQLRVEIDGMTHTCEGVYVAKGRYYAGPWSFAPNARIDEPLLHIVMLKRVRRRDFLAFILATLAGRVDGLSNVQIVTGQQVNISADSKQVVQADGDIATTVPAQIAILPASLCP